MRCNKGDDYFVFADREAELGTDWKVDCRFSSPFMQKERGHNFGACRVFQGLFITIHD